MSRADRRMGGSAVRRRAPRADWPFACALLTLVSAAPTGRPVVPVEPPSRRSAQEGAGGRGKVVYDQWCMECHGEGGAGDGSAAAFMLPRPRDFIRASYQIRTTASGELPTDADIRRVIDLGMPGTAMPAWGAKLSAAERDDLVAYLKSFSSFFEGEAPAPIAVGEAPRSTAEGLAEGRATFEKLECAKCHGQAGRGDGPSAPTLRDDWDVPIRAADLTQSWMFNGGSTVEDIYLRLRTGLDGTPMPSFSDVIDAEVITDQQLWRVAQYVRSLSPKNPPQPREVVRAHLVQGSLPAGPGDTLWSGVERYYVPLVGQIIQRPRWFTPMAEGLWVQAVHDGTTLAMRVTWGDRSASPDAAWDEWLAGMAATAADVDGPPPTAQGPDRLTIQFPARPAEDLERPYFLGGDRQRPVHLWRWSSSPDRVEEGTGSAFGQFTARADGPQVTHQAQHDQGGWQVQFTRALASTDSSRVPGFRPGRVVPIAFFAADGSNGETDARGSISAWYGVYLDEPTPPTVFIAPILATMLTAGLGVLVVWRAQRREPRRRAPTSEV